MADEDLQKQSKPELIQLAKSLSAELDRLEARVAELEEQLRDSKRAKAAFSKG